MSQKATLCKKQMVKHHMVAEYTEKLDVKEAACRNSKPYNEPSDKTITLVAGGGGVAQGDAARCCPGNCIWAVHCEE